ncbi:MAG: hypothetical protein QNJ97_23620 [Myxococcota bacterium]|nr:hypothetical protein [Myxococcota bacterium]
MTVNSSTRTSTDAVYRVNGELTRRLTWQPVRILEVATGLLLIRGILVLIARFCLGLRRRATLAVQDAILVLDSEYSILGRGFRRTRTTAPIADILAVRIENQRRYVYLVVGIGSLTIGVWLGVQWFVDGLRAGYPYLALVGAGLILLGLLVDLLLYFFFPKGRGRTRLIVALGPWTIRISGVNVNAAKKLSEIVASHWIGAR